MELPKRYDSKEREKYWQEYWIKEGIFKFDPDSKKEIYSIDTPPPTVSGKMHLGHAFSYSQQDFIARYQRMKGKSVFYPFGTDDNGLATERLIEKMKKVKASKMDRDEFVKLCLETLDKELRPQYVEDWKRIGMSCDWDIFYTTINEHSQKISQNMFLDLVKKKRVYKKFSPVIFCPKCQTSIAQVEMEDMEKETNLVYVKGKVDDRYIIYATTRPELHPACVGISIDKEGDYVTAKSGNEKWIIAKDAVEKMQEEFSIEVVDEFKGKELVGKEVEVFLAINKVKISHDESASTEYGTGVVYYCTYGGLDCVEWMARHKDVEPVHIMDETGRYNEKTPFEGMNSQEARDHVMDELEKNDLLVKKEKMKHSSNVHERCQTPIEYVALSQWFVKYLDLKDDFLKRGKELNWYPEHMRNRYENWIKGLQWDWCISRQRYSGVPFPVWYDKKTNEPIFASEEELPVDPLKSFPKGYDSSNCYGEEDIMDTWATSSLTPRLAIDLFKDHKVYSKLKTMNLRPQAHDIITFWLFNTVVRSHIHDDALPWKDVCISGWALDPKGKKMSKSKGNVVEPQVMIDKYSADALRFWAGGSKLGDDLPFQEKDLLTGQKSVTKIWNASKFALMHLEDYEDSKIELDVMDKWLLSKLSKLIRSNTESFDKYEYSRTKMDTEKFFWKVFCDNYLEIVKDRLYNPDKRGEDKRKSAQYGLYHSLLGVLKMFAPIMPYITEEIYHLYFSKKEDCKSIHNSVWPTLDMVDDEAEKIGDIAIEIIEHVRRAKSEKNVSLKEPVKSMNIKAKLTAEEFNSVIDEIKAVTKCEEIEFEEITPPYKSVDLVVDLVLE